MDSLSKHVTPPVSPARGAPEGSDVGVPHGAGSAPCAQPPAGLSLGWSLPDASRGDIAAASVTASEPAGTVRAVEREPAAPPNGAGLPPVKRHLHAVPGGDLDEPQRAQAHLQRLRLIEQFSRNLSAGWELPRILRLALRTAIAGVPHSIGAQVSLLDSTRHKLTVVDAIGWQARRLKSRELELDDFPAVHPLASAEGKTATTMLITCDGPGGRFPFVAEGVHLFASPLMLQGEVAGLLGLSRGGRPVCDDEESLFLQLMADLVASAVANTRLWREVAEHTREVAVLEEVDLRAMRGLPLMRVLGVLTRTARELTKSERSSLNALNADGQSQTRLMMQGQGLRWLRKRYIPMQRGLAGWVIQHGEPAFSNDLPSDPRVDPQIMHDLGLHSGAVVPLLVNGKVIGCLSVYNRPQQEPYAQHDVSVLTHLATHAVTAIENASLSDRYQRSPLARTLIWQMLSDRRRGLGHLAVVEERARIARDLHDGLAQNLSNLNFRLQLVEQMVAETTTHDRDAVRGELAIIRAAVCGMYDEVRDRIGALDRRGQWDNEFTRALARSVEEFAATSGMQVALDLRAGPVKLPPLIGLRILQIMEEALVNAQKHARASQVCVALHATDRQLELSISDNGRGFRPERTRSREGHFGLCMMRERAREIGARFTIAAQRDQGTKVVVTLPVPQGVLLPCNGQQS